SSAARGRQTSAAAAAEQKKSIGRYANELKQAIEGRWKTSEESARDEAPAGSARVTLRRRERVPAGPQALTLPGRVRALAHRHPLTIVRDQLEAIFGRMGFAVVEGPEA